MPISQLQHVNIRCADADAARTFYSQVLGLKDGKRPAFDSAGYWMYLGDEPIVHLVQRPGDDQRAPGSASLDHIGFGGVDLPATRAALAALGIPYQERVVPLEGTVQIFVRDPDGIKVEINFVGAGAE